VATGPLGDCDSRFMLQERCESQIRQRRAAYGAQRQFKPTWLPNGRVSGNCAPAGIIGGVPIQMALELLTRLERSLVCASEAMG
jgi:hypothetical protein